MGNGALQDERTAAPPAGEALDAGLRRVLAVDLDERAPRRIVGALAGALPDADLAALVIRGEDGRLELAAAAGLDERTAAVAGGLAAEALAARELRISPAPGTPFPQGTRIAAALAGVKR